MDTNPDTAAARVTATMEARGHTIKGTADASGIPVTTFRRKIAGHSDFTVTELAKVAAALDVQPLDLLPYKVAA